MKTIITTVGTSIFENYMHNDIKDIVSYVAINKQVQDLRNLEAKHYNSDGGNESHISKQIENKWFKGITKDANGDWDKAKNSSDMNTYASAEIQSIIAIIKESEKASFKLYFLASDTVLSLLASNLIKLFFETYKADIKNKKGVNISIDIYEPIVINKLQIKNANDFQQEAILDLIEQINSIKGDQESQEIVLNISGGYKGIIPIMTIIGQLEGYDLNYMYEDSQEVITIGQLPISFDWAVLESVGSYLNDESIQALFNKRNNAPSKKIYDKIKELKLIIEGNNTAKLSIIGQLLHSYIFKSNLKNKILGDFMEYKMYYHFASKKHPFYCLPEKKDIKKIYKISSEGVLEFSDMSISKKGKLSITEEQKRMGWEELGDIDLLLNDSTVLAEVKAFNQFLNYVNDIDTPADYYKKILARISYQKEINKNTEKIPTEFLFIIYKVVIFEETNEEFFDSENFIKIFKHFKAKINAYHPEVKFKALGVQVNLRKGHLEVDYTTLLKKDFESSSFLIYE